MKIYESIVGFGELGEDFLHLIREQQGIVSDSRKDAKCSFHTHKKGEKCADWGAPEKTFDFSPFQGRGSTPSRRGMGGTRGACWSGLPVNGLCIFAQPLCFYFERRMLWRYPKTLHKEKQSHITYSSFVLHLQQLAVQLGSLA